jgi:hypothetical protein
MNGSQSHDAHRESGKNSLPTGAMTMAIASAAMIAQQVAGKATRDAMFLTNFDVTNLPMMMAASAVLSIVVVIWLSKMILRHSPERVVPVSFAVSGVALLAGTLLVFRMPDLSVRRRLDRDAGGPPLLAAERHATCAPRPEGVGP